MFHMKLTRRVTVICLLCLTTLILVNFFKQDILDTKLPKDIKLVEWESLYSRHLDLESNQHATSTCSFNAYDQNIQNTFSTSNMKDWSFKHRIHCPKVNFTNYSSKREGLLFTCTRNSSNVYTVKKVTTADVSQIPFGNMCLADVIDHCCKMKNDTIPNVVHYVFCGKQELGFFQFLSCMSVVRFIRPCMVLFHGDTLPSGHYWNYFISIYSNVVHVKRDCFYGGKGHRLGYFEHGTDLMRIEALLVYGGIYLDWDEILLQPIDDLRKYDYVQETRIFPCKIKSKRVPSRAEITFRKSDKHGPYFEVSAIKASSGFEQKDELITLLGSQFIMAKRNAAFLRRWYSSYSTDYKRYDWGYNALIVSAKLAEKYPDLIHIAKYHFSRPSWDDRHLIYSTNYNWTLNYGMHLYLRDYKTYTDEMVIRNLKTTIGAISRHVLFGNKELCL